MKKILIAFSCKPFVLLSTKPAHRDTYNYQTRRDIRTKDKPVKCLPPNKPTWTKRSALILRRNYGDLRKRRIQRRQYDTNRMARVHHWCIFLETYIQEHVASLIKPNTPLFLLYKSNLTEKIHRTSHRWQTRMHNCPVHEHESLDLSPR